MKKIDNVERKLGEIRKDSRNTIYKMIIFLSSLIGISFSLLFSETFTNLIDKKNLFSSWDLILITIFIGFIVLFLEPRIRYAKEWRYFLVSTNVELFSKNKLHITFTEKIKLFYLLTSSVLVPRNNTLDKIQKNEEDKLRQQNLSLKLLEHIAKIEIIILWIENIFFVLFFASLFVLIKSVNL